MNDPLRVGLVGCGVITQRTLPGLSTILTEHSGTITALCDPYQPAMDQVASMLAGNSEVACFTALDALIDAACCDAVLIASPIGMHFGQVQAALQGGLHVYSHKTLAATRAECEALGQLANSAERCLAASPGQILLPAYRRAAKLVHEGALGAVVTIDAAAEAAAHRFEAERANELPNTNENYSWEWYHNKQAGGGPLDDMFVYPLAFLTEVFGEVVDAKVFAQLTVPHIAWRDRIVKATAPDSYCGVLRFSDAVATIRSSFSSNTQFVPWGTIIIRGTKAALEIIKHNDLDYSLFITPNEGQPWQEHLPVFNEADRDALGTKECHVLTDIREFITATRLRREVTGATAMNAARVVGALRMIEQHTTGEES